MPSAQSNSSREFDLVIFGATGLVGVYAVRELMHSIDSNPTEYISLRWAVAGRNVNKLDSVLDEIGTEFGKNLSSIIRIRADVRDSQSIVHMVGRTQSVLNCVGLYRLYGA